MGSRGSDYGSNKNPDSAEYGARYYFSKVNGQWEVAGDDYQPLGTVSNPKVASWLEQNANKYSSGNIMEEMKKALGDVSLF